ncbi:MAG: hypothetical protein E7485_03395 [Ruminococcaceae bacterium]|nr:hypothetical protein [Oscillospiraceae bacterium]
MRITNSTMLRNYDRNLKRLSTNKFNSEQKIFTGRSFSRASENPLNAAKALTVRKQLSRMSQYMENLDVADKFYTEAETSMLQISDQLATVRETLIAACNSIKEENVDLKIYAQQLETKAKEMCAIFNTDTAERVIFGGESNDPEPFSLSYDENGFADEMLYHGVPINAYTDCKNFPYSNDVYIDIGIGMVVDQETQAIDSQTALKVSFNGADVTGCGVEEYKASLDAEQLEDGKKYTLNFYVEGKTTQVSFIAGADAATSIANLNTELTAAYNGKKAVPVVDADGNITAGDATVYVTNNADSENKAAVENDYGFAKNYIQITLDAAKALREGDIEYANACIDRIVTSTENLLIEIADLGNAEEFIEFNQTRFETRELNLKDRQDTLEATDLEYEITLQKTYEALYNACLQMSSTVVPNSIFSYIR